MKNVFFDDDFIVNENNVCIIELNEVSDLTALLNELYLKLKFPNYFGFNWNALSDCLRDLDWIEEKEIIIIHRKLPLLQENDLKVYLNVLFDAVNDWKEGEKHYLTVVFPERYKSLIEKHLKKSD